jgi:hypothetical protein
MSCSSSSEREARSLGDNFKKIEINPDPTDLMSEFMDK